MVQELQKFRADHKGNCVGCHKPKPLDAMIKETAKGYKCVDCVVEDEARDLCYSQKKPTIENLEFKEIINKGKFNKMLRWCLG